MSPSRKTNLPSPSQFAQARSESDLIVKVKEVFFQKFSVIVEKDGLDLIVNPEKNLFSAESFLWAEAKIAPTEVYTMFTQLLLASKKKRDRVNGNTRSKERDLDDEHTPNWLGVFDREKIAFVEYGHVLEILHRSDFNWNETPSSPSEESIRKVRRYLENQIVQYDFVQDEAEIRSFIEHNFVIGSDDISKVQINKNNFVTIYIKWVREVLPSIDLSDDDWEDLRQKGVKDCDFYLADLMSENNKTIWDKLNIVLQMTYYESRVQFSSSKLKFYYEKIGFRDQGEKHAQFWAKYERPPAQEYREHITERRDLLVPQDIRERKGAFFTPLLWVEKSQEYLAKVFGENWQEEYYVWDCCAGTCNLLAGLTNKYNVWASTIDQPDVDIVHEIIDRGTLNLLKSHVFQFDFLNDDFDKLPQELQDIINDPEKQKKLIVYMNPPYAESGNKATIVSRGKNKSQVAVSNVYNAFQGKAGTAVREIFAQFILQIYHLMPNAKLAMFSPLKHVSAPNFIKFREHFKAKYENGFVCRANTFDNVNGQFAIGFLIWDLANKKTIRQVKTDVLINDKLLTTCWKEGVKKFYSYNTGEFSIDWLRQFFDKENESIGFMRLHRNDMQNKDAVYITSQPKESDIRKREVVSITKNNLVEMAIYVAIRQVFGMNWLNNRDQFLYPNDGYKTDTEFQNNCLIFTLFHEKNKICSKDGVNRWIPFTAKEVNSKDNFKSTLMSDFLKKRKNLSEEAKAVFEAGKTLWKYYHKTIQAKKKVLVDASLYEIREYFKGRDEKGRMKTKSTDDRFNDLDAELRASLKILAEKIQPKVYEYGFLKK